ncbi:DUF1737 domain-containing protein [Leuconostoc falkenbergense]|nr:DUF1737 domain-containing protein [Leuconostoc falkenbergense]
MKYIVLKVNSPFNLEKVVNEHIKHGWIPTGGVTVQQQHPYFY